MPAALAVNWAEIRSACEGGVTIEKVAEEFGMSAGTIRARIHREKWAVPSIVQRMQREVQQKHQNSPSAATLVAESLSERQTLHREQFHRIAVALAKRTEKAIEDGKIVPESVADVEKLQKITRLNLEMTTGEETKIAVGFWQTGGACFDGGSGEVIDADVIEPADEPDLTEMV